MRIPESVFDVPTPCVNVRTGNMVVFDARTGNHAKPPIVNDDNTLSWPGDRWSRYRYTGEEVEVGGKTYRLLTKI